MDKEQALAVQRMQDYIDARLHEPITLKQLADVAGYSPWHAAKMFKAIVGDAPFEYIRALRLSSAALRLRDTDERVLDVALDFQFDSHEGFTHAFHRQFGLSPDRYRRAAPPVWLYTSFSAMGRYALNKPEEALTPGAIRLDARLTSFPRRKLLLKRGKNAENYFDYCEEVGCDVWGLLCSVREALNEPMGLWLPDSLRPQGTSRYAQGVELPASYAGMVPEGFELMELPACDMLVFKSEPFDDAAMGGVIAAAWEAIDAYDPTPMGCEWATDAQPRFQLEPEGWRGYIEGRPVRVKG